MLVWHATIEGKGRCWALLAWLLCCGTFELELEDDSVPGLLVLPLVLQCRVQEQPFEWNSTTGAVEFKLVIVWLICESDYVPLCL